MESLYLLIPLSVVLALLGGGVLAWAALSGQFEALEAEGRRILDDSPQPASDPSPPTDSSSDADA